MEEVCYGAELNSPGILLLRAVARGCILTRKRKLKHSLTAQYWKNSLAVAAKLWVKSQQVFQRTIKEG
jgi:hypothetical protein